jgi:hypothetical protein
MSPRPTVAVSSSAVLGSASRGRSDVMHGRAFGHIVATVVGAFAALLVLGVR